MRTTLAAILLACAGAAPALANDNGDWLWDLNCSTKPTDAPSGYVLKAYRKYASLTEAKVELYSWAPGRADTLEAVFPAQKDVNTGGADELISRFVGPDIVLESRLDLRTDPPGPDAERSFAQLTQGGRTVTLDLTCY